VVEHLRFITEPVSTILLIKNGPIKNSTTPYLKKHEFGVLIFSSVNEPVDQLACERKKEALATNYERGEFPTCRYLRLRGSVETGSTIE
jgi:hypothetical protein